MGHSLPALLAAIALVAQGGPAWGREKAEKETVFLQPSSPWAMNYAEDSCHLARRFGEGDEAVTVEFRQFGQSENFILLLAGKSLDPSNTEPLQFVFEPLEPHEPRHNVLGGKLADGKTVIQFQSTFRPDETKPDKDSGPEDYAPIVPDRATEASIQTLAVWGPFAGKYRIALGAMDKPMDAMRSCVAGLLERWGLDVGAHLRLSRRAVPIGAPANWLKSHDYPAEQVRKAMSGSVQFRLMLDAEGKPHHCKVQMAIGDEAFEKTTCKLLLRRAKFSPALDANGKAIPSYYVNSVLWVTP